MAHFAVVAPALYSHFNTLTVLARELVARGHRVTFVHRKDAAAYVKDERIGFHAVGMNSHPAGSLPAMLARVANPGSPLGLRRVILDMAASTTMLCRELPDALRRLQVDFIVADQMEAAGGLVAEGIGMPFVSVACALPVNREPGIPLPVMPFMYEDSERAFKMVEGSTMVYDWMMRPHERAIAATAQQLGLSPRAKLHECLSPLAQVGQIVPGFDFPRRALPPHFHHVGPLHSGAAAPASSPAELAALLPPASSTRPFVYASLGTLVSQRFGLFKRIAQACKHQDAQLLVAHCGGLDDGQVRALERIGDTRVHAFVPQLAVLARADAVISHAGANTVMEAIATRTPILALPIAFDHPGAAARVEYAGVGLRASPRFATVAELSRKLRRLLDEPGFRQRMEPLAEQIRQAGGAPRAADVIEAALGLVPESRRVASHG
ncbi:Zeaxanthin glucosyltransferase [Massilia aurea]|uniref:Zeaxanthin glucosyltransferase n=1 Tax=Massilia aurea TaxID=373040 RepID=A0A422QET5_9BURK|nr:glycosyltransferase [Massilia aurea]RNF28532.1 Zeaxanthin glucosyltransferase [Massilia aurea]